MDIRNFQKRKQGRVGCRKHSTDAKALARKLAREHQIQSGFEDDRRLPGIIATYENDLTRMETGEPFAGKPVTEELKDQWRNAIASYKEQWDEAQASWEDAE